MNSIKFPNMFSGNGMAVWKQNEYNEATRQNMRLLIATEKGSLLGDPYIGLSNFLFEQNSPIAHDTIADSIYTQVALFMPQIKITRKDVKIVQDKLKGKATCTVSGINQFDYSVDTYSLVLFDNSKDIGV